MNPSTHALSPPYIQQMFLCDRSAHPMTGQESQRPCLQVSPRPQYEGEFRIQTHVCHQLFLWLKSIVNQTFTYKSDTNVYWLEIQNTTGARRCFSPDSTHICWRSFILRGCFIVGEGLKGVFSNTFFTLLLASATCARFAMVSQNNHGGPHDQVLRLTMKNSGTAIGHGVWFWHCSGGFNHNCVWSCGFETMVWELLFWNNVVHHVLWSTSFEFDNTW